MRRIHCLMALVGVLSMLLMPVDYRGGAAVSHPHATIQLIADLAGGSLDHHGETPVRHSHPPARSVWSPLGPLTEGLATPGLATPGLATPGLATPGLALEASRWWPITHTAATISALANLAWNDLVVSPKLDPEQLTPWSSLTGQYVLYALALPPLMFLAWTVNRVRFDRRPAGTWQGVLTAPEPPPPR